MNVNEMTLDEVRDFLMWRDGWSHVLRHRHASGADQWCWERDNGDETFDHPHPATLDGAAAALPEGWTWWKVTAEWAAQAAHSPMIYIPDTGDEIADRYRLALACRLAEKGDKQ